MAKKVSHVTPDSVAEFFANDELLDYVVLRPLDHIRANWDLIWEGSERHYRPEDDSFGQLINDLVQELARTTPPTKYHDNEDRLAEYVRDGRLKWPIRKVGRRWVGAHYHSILEQGGFDDVDQKELVLAATGRIWAAIDRAQLHFEDMEESHRDILAAVLSIVLYHRA
jgi:hypothetical protein